MYGLSGHALNDAKPFLQAFCKLVGCALQRGSVNAEKPMLVSSSSSARQAAFIYSITESAKASRWDRYAIFRSCSARIRKAPRSREKLWNTRRTAAYRLVLPSSAGQSRRTAKGWARRRTASLKSVVAAHVAHGGTAPALCRILRQHTFNVSAGRQRDIGKVQRNDALIELPGNIGLFVSGSTYGVRKERHPMQV